MTPAREAEAGTGTSVGKELFEALQSLTAVWPSAAQRFLRAPWIIDKAVPRFRGLNPGDIRKAAEAMIMEVSSIGPKDNILVLLRKRAFEGQHKDIDIAVLWSVDKITKKTTYIVPTDLDRLKQDAERGYLSHDQLGDLYYATTKWMMSCTPCNKCRNDGPCCDCIMGSYPLGIHRKDRDLALKHHYDWVLNAWRVARDKRYEVEGQYRRMLQERRRAVVAA